MTRYPNRLELMKPARFSHEQYSRFKGKLVTLTLEVILELISTDSTNCYKLLTLDCTVANTSIDWHTASAS